MATNSCSVPMETLTNALSWTAATLTDIEVQVTATNIDGTSAAGTQTSTIQYLYIPQQAPSLTVTTTSDVAANINFTCLTQSQSGQFAATVALDYIVSYKDSASSTWTDLSTVTCAQGTDATKLVTSPVLTTVTTYQFRIKAVNDIGTGPITAVASYQTITTYGKPSTPARPMLVQNTDKTVTATFYRPDPLNSPTGTSCSYHVQIKDDGGDYVALGTLTNSAASFTKVYTMAELKTATGYTDAQNGAQIELKYTVQNAYSTSDLSEVNLN